MPHLAFIENPVAEAGSFARLHSQAMKQGAWSEHAFVELCAQPGVFAAVTKEEGAMVGFLLIRIAADECEILTLAVAPGKQREGIATHLLAKILYEAKKRGATSCFLEVAQSNNPAIELYKRWKFTAIGQRDGYYSLPDGQVENGLVMRLALDPSMPD